MRIAYIVGEDISQSSGVVKKVTAQVKFWKSKGHDVQVISLKSDSMNSVIENGIILTQYVREKNFKKKFIRRFTVAAKLNNFLSKNKPDIIYTRYIMSMPDIFYVLKKYAPYIVEINSNDVEESKLGKKSHYINNILTRSFCLSNASGFVSVSKELMSNNVFTKFNKKFIIIGNGYDFNNVKNIKEYYNTPIKFIFIGTPNQEWHGTDKILKLAEKLNNYEFHIVGPTENDLSNSGKIGSNVIVHGYCDSEYISELILKCDIGISTLALHRNNMNEASPLKSREYLAHGLPIIIGYEDTDLLKDFQFILKIGNYEHNVLDNISQIEHFANSCKDIKPESLINISRKYLDYKEKEKIRLTFLEKTIKKDD